MIICLLPVISLLVSDDDNMCFPLVCLCVKDRCEIEEKYTMVVASLMLSLIQGKTIFFVNSVDSCYK